MKAFSIGKWFPRVSPWFPHSYVFVLNSWEPRPANHRFHRFLRWEPFSVPIWVGDRNGRAASHPCKCGRNSQGPEKVAMENEMPGQMEMEWDGNEAFIHIFLFLHSPSYLQASCWITIWYYCAFVADPVVVDQPGATNKLHHGPPYGFVNDVLLNPMAKNLLRTSFSHILDHPNPIILQCCLIFAPFENWTPPLCARAAEVVYQMRQRLHFGLLRGWKDAAQICGRHRPREGQKARRKMGTHQGERGKRCKNLGQMDQDPRDRGKGDDNLWTFATCQGSKETETSHGDHFEGPGHCLPISGFPVIGCQSKGCIDATLQYPLEMIQWDIWWPLS